jgi:hypothetical protein
VIELGRRFVCALAGLRLLGLGALAMICCLLLELGGLGGSGGLRLSCSALHLLSVLAGPVGVFRRLLHRFVVLFFVLDVDHSSTFGGFPSERAYPVWALPILHLMGRRCMVCTNL